MLLVLVALTVIIGLQSVGIVLVAALLVTPAAAAYQLTKRFTPMLVISIVIGAVSAVGGLYLLVLRARARAARRSVLVTTIYSSSRSASRACVRRGRGTDPHFVAGAFQVTRIR